MKRKPRATAEDAAQLRSQGAFEQAFATDLEVIDRRLAKEPLLDETFVTDLHELCGTYHEAGYTDFARKLEERWAHACETKYANASTENAQVQNERGAFFEFYLEDLVPAALHYERGLRIQLAQSETTFASLRIAALRTVEAMLKAQQNTAARELRTAVETQLRARFGSSDNELLHLWQTAADAYTVAGEHEEAARLHEAHLAELDQRPAPPINGQCFMALNAANAHSNAGNFSAALPLAQRGVAHATQWLGEQDPFTAHALAILARCEIALLHYDDADEHLQKALPTLRNAKDKEPAFYAFALLTEGSLHTKRHAYAHARRSYETLLALAKAHPEECSNTAREAQEALSALPQH